MMFVVIIFRTLDLSFNRIKSITGLDTLVNLDKLYFVQNKISVIENLTHQTEVTMLELGANRIRVSFTL